MTSSLIQRLEQADGADRADFCAVMKVIGVPPESLAWAHVIRFCQARAWESAALNLVELGLDFETLPDGSQLLIERYGEHDLEGYTFEWCIRLEVWHTYPTGERDRRFMNTRHRSLVSALLIALLKAVEAQNND